MPSNRRRYERRRLDDLRDHPDQEALQCTLSDIELTALADDIAANGQLTPIEITPDGTILDGHQRVRALRILDRTTARVWVRRRLANKGTDALRRRFLTANLTRKHLSPLARARLLAELLDVEDRDECIVQRKQRLARANGMSVRHVNRLLRVLQTPRVVQDAYDRGDIGIAETLRAASLTERVQRRIATAIESGRPARKVIREMVARQQKRAEPRGVGQEQALAALAASIARCAERLDGERVARDIVSRHSEALQRGRTLIERLLREK